ncbi:MAG TPA: periplasmic heavy metal sensor [Bryobacteraceae bacterium]|jgi:Spy/CpxP family protein refolding chaperone|nr:periplasmic heavy metal sensor [Bryobacteraceae bacterium]
MRKFSLFSVLLLLLGLSLPSAAQSRVGFAWWNSPIRADLNLTREQDEKIRRIVRTYRDRLLDARNNVQKADGDLEDLLNDETVNPAAAKPIIERVANARANAARVSLELSIELRSVLTLDQWRTLVRKYAEMRKNQNPSETQVTP